jgi:hypothetical protein
MGILTGGYPAEYGRKLGGIIEVVTAEDAARGFHGVLGAAGGSFDTRAGDAAAQYGWQDNTITGTGAWSGTDRYLDPPVRGKFFEPWDQRPVLWAVRPFAERWHRLGIIVRHGHSSFLVPNERLQQEAGQRQARNGRETLGQFSYQRIARSTCFSTCGAWRAGWKRSFSSNEASTPIRAQAESRPARRLSQVHAERASRAARMEGRRRRGLRRRAGAVLVSHHGPRSGSSKAHRPAFAFSGRANDREQALFVQDRHLARRSGRPAPVLRWDRYAFLVHDRALSPRVGRRLVDARTRSGGAGILRSRVSDAFVRKSASRQLCLRGSVERTSGSAPGASVRAENFYEAGMTKGFFGRVRVDASAYRRRIQDFADDDVLLNTGVTFPIAFSRADIRGGEVKVTVPMWKRVSGFLSYANMTGVGFLPVHGGLLLGDEVGALSATDRFVVTQDQRNTAAARAMYTAGRLSVAIGAAYGSGLPVEFRRVGRRSRRAVRRARGQSGGCGARPRPAIPVVDSSVAYSLGGDTGDLRIQADVSNLTNRLRVINFAGVFSGTALASPRAVSIRVQASF